MLTGQPSPWENPHREIIAIEVETFLTLFHHYSQNQLIPGDQLGVIRSTSGGVPDDPPTTFLGPFIGALWPKTSSHSKNGPKPKTWIIHRGSIFSPKGVLWYFSILPPSSLGQKNGEKFFSLGSILDQYWVPLLLIVHSQLLLPLWSATSATAPRSSPGPGHKCSVFVSVFVSIRCLIKCSPTFFAW